MGSVLDVGTAIHHTRYHLIFQKSDIYSELSYFILRPVLYDNQRQLDLCIGEPM